MLALSGGALGALLAVFGTRPFIAIWPGALPRAVEVRFDWRVLLFALGVSVFSGILFGLAPALRAPVNRLEQVLRDGARGSIRASHRLHSVFVVSEVALAVVLLVCAGMLGRTMLRLSGLNPGVNIDNVLIARVSLSPTLNNAARIRAEWSDRIDRASRVPGAEWAAAVDTVPMRQGNNQIGYWITPTAPPENLQPIMLATTVTPSYLGVMGIPLRKGRFLSESDRMGSQRVVVVDEVLALQAFGSLDPIGRHIWFSLGNEPWTVVGVVGHVRHWGLAGDDSAQVRAQLYYPFAQVPDQYIPRWSELMSIAVRTRVPALNLLPGLRQAVKGATGDQALYQVRTMDQLARGTLARQRFLLTLFGIFAGVALALACIGIYGVLAYLTSRRVPEIGVRMALGAGRREVVLMVLRQSFAMIAAGVLAGTAAAVAAAAVLSHSRCRGNALLEPSTFILMIAVLVGAALIASFLPAKRAGGIDPMQALR